MGIQAPPLRRDRHRLRPHRRRQAAAGRGPAVHVPASNRIFNVIHVAFPDAKTKLNGAASRREVVAAFACRIRIVLTDNGDAVVPNASTLWDPSRRIVKRVCGQHGIEHRLTEPCHPGTNDQAEPMTRTIKDAASFSSNPHHRMPGPHP